MRFPCSTGVRDLLDCVAQNPYWTRSMVLFFWYLMGIPVAYMMQSSCSVRAPGIWAHAGRVFIEGLVAFALGASIYVGITRFPYALYVDFRFCRCWTDIYYHCSIPIGYCRRPSLKRYIILELQNQCESYQAELRTSLGLRSDVLSLIPVHCRRPPPPGLSVFISLNCLLMCKDSLRATLACKRIISCDLCSSGFVMT
jgi:hypothetical protein